LREFLFDQLKIIRNNTINAVKELSQNQAVEVPEGFNNSILWNLGHIYRPVRLNEPINNING